MRAVKEKAVLLLMFSVLLFSVSYGQKSHDGWEVGACFGVSHYFGDLNTNFDLSKPGFTTGMTVRYSFNDRLSYKTSLNFLRIQETDADSSNPFERARNLHFRSNIYDFSNQFEFNFMPFVQGTGNYFSPYFLLGLSVFYYNPQAEYEGTWYNLREYGTEGQITGEEYFTYNAGLIYGAGIKWNINYNISINVEIAGRRLSTDYLDDVSTVYPNMGEVGSLRGDIGVALSNPSEVDGFGAQGTQRGNSKDNDSYVTTTVSFLYYFGQLDCPNINQY
jgi:hypothetical protein